MLKCYTPQYKSTTQLQYSLDDIFVIHTHLPVCECELPNFYLWQKRKIAPSAQQLQTTNNICTRIVTERFKPSPVYVFHVQLGSIGVSFNPFKLQIASRNDTSAVKQRRKKKRGKKRCPGQT